MTDGQKGSKKVPMALVSMVGVAVLVFAIVTFGSGNSSSNIAAVNASDSVTVRFLIAHQPVSVFERSNKVFAEELERLSEGTMTLEVLMPEDFGIIDRDLTQDEVYSLMDEGKVDVSSTQTSSFSSDVPKTDIFLMPFLFRNYDSILSFFNSDEGQIILDEVTDNTRVHALAYTFSGGFRVVMLRDENVTLAGLAEKQIAALGNDITREGLATLGAETVVVNAETTKRDTEGVDGVEVSYTRLSGLNEPTTMKSVIETDMSVLATIMVADDDFFSSLSVDQQDALQQAALTSAALEREDSIALANQVREDLIEQGVSVVSISEEERSELRDKSSSVYEEFEDRFGEEFLRAVLDMQN